MAACPGTGYVPSYPEWHGGAAAPAPYQAAVTCPPGQLPLCYDFGGNGGLVHAAATTSMFASGMPPQAPPQQPQLLYVPACEQPMLLQPGALNGGAVVLSAPPAPGAAGCSGQPTTQPLQGGCYQPGVQAAPLVMHCHQGSGMLAPRSQVPVAYLGAAGHTSISYAAMPATTQACSSPDSAYSSSDTSSCGSTYMLAGAPASFGGPHQAVGSVRRPGYVSAPVAPPHTGSSAAFYGSPATGGPALHSTSIITGPLQAQAGLQQQQRPRLGPSSSLSKRNKWGVDERLVCGTPWEVAWEVLRTLPAVQPVLDLERDTACLRNVYLHEAPTAAPASPGSEASTAAMSSGSASPQLSILDRTCELETPLEPEQLLSEEGLVRACRGLPARVRDDLIRAARLAVTRKEPGNGVGTGLLPFFWRVHTNLKWLMQQPATIKGQLSPGEIEFITNEQRSLSLRKTVAQRMRLSQMAVLLHRMLQVPAEDAALMAAAAAAAGVLRPAC